VSTAAKRLLVCVICAASRHRSRTHGEFGERLVGQSKQRSLCGIERQPLQ